MRPRLMILSTVWFLSLVLCSSVTAQEPSVLFARLSAGTGFVERPSALHYLNGHGLQLMLRVGHRVAPHWAVIADLGQLRLGRYDGVVPAFFCARDVPRCAPFSGPLQETTLGVGIAVARSVGVGEVGFDLTPSWTWFSAQDSTARSSPSVALGTTLALGRGVWHPLFEARYRQALRPSSLLTSVFQFGIGLRWR